MVGTSLCVIRVTEARNMADIGGPPMTRQAQRLRVPWAAVLDERLAPPPGAPERADYVRWLVLAATALQPAVVEAMLARETGNEARLAMAREAFARHAGVVEHALDGRS